MCPPVVTIVIVAAISGRFLQWQRIDQAVGIEDPPFVIGCYGDVLLPGREIGITFCATED